MTGPHAPTFTHPARKQLVAFGQGRLPEEEARLIEQHVAECSVCCEVLQQGQEDTLVALARAALEDTPRLLKTPPPPRPTQAGLLPTNPAKIRLQVEEIPPELRDHPRYRIVERLGEGGMGVVYKAEHRMMERLVALKVISLDFTAHPTAVERFRQEVRAAAKLSHANIVTAHDAEQAGDLHFLVMEYVDGVSLGRLVEKKGPLPPAQAALFARQVAQGLHHAHLHGMIHRDIKPQNLMVTRKGLVKILDFGLARFTTRTGTDLTKAEMIVGTPDYMAPEQARDSRSVDTRADLYSLGCTLYYLLAGRTPFQADSAIALMFKHCEEEPVPVESLRSDVPPELLAVMRKLMAKKPAERYQTPAEAAAALLPFLRPISQTLDLPGRGPVEEELPVAELLDDASTTPTVPEASRTVPSGTKLPKRRPRPKAFWKRHGSKVIATTVVVLGLLGALAAWPYLRERGNEGPGNGGEIAGNQPRGSVIHNTPPQRSEPPANTGHVQRPLENGGSASAARPDSERTPDVHQGAPPGNPSARQVLFILPEELWYADYGPVRGILEQEGFGVKTASFATVCRAVDQEVAPQRPDYRLEQVRMADFAAVVFVGKETRPYADSGHAAPQIKRLLAEAQSTNKLVTAICTGQYVLWRHGVLRGVRIAGSPYTKDMANQSDAGESSYLAHAVRQPVVVSGRIITGSGPEAAIEFGNTLVAQLRK